MQAPESKGYVPETLLPDGFSPSSYVSTVLSHDKFVKEVDKLCGRGNLMLKQALIDVCMMSTHGCPFFPVSLASFIHEIPFYKLSYKPEISSVARVLAYVKCYYIGVSESVICDFDMPFRLTCEPLTFEIAKNLSIVTEKGIKSLGYGNGSALLEYIVPKYDGNPFRTFKLKFEWDGMIEQRVFCLFNNTFRLMPDDFPIISGEIVGDTLYMYYGINFAVDNFDTFILGDSVIHVVGSMPVTLDDFITRSSNAHTDGYVFGICGNEYKIKVHSTIDLLYDGVGYATGPNLSVPVRGGNPEDKGICEFIMRDGMLFFFEETIG